MKALVITVLLFTANFFYAQELSESEVRVNSLINGTLLQPAQKTDTLAIIIAGSGPTDRNGNQQMSQNNSLKKLAQELTKKGIATFRYDKRLFALLRNNALVEENLRFDNFVTDAVDVINYFKEKGFNTIILIGHSQGALVGTLAAQQAAITKFIALSGAGQPLDRLVIDQLTKQAPGLVENAEEAFSDLKTKGKSENFNIGLLSLMRPAVQPFMKSWIEYDPAKELSELDIPVLIISGTNDIQVPPTESKILHEASPNSKLVLIASMNHVLKDIEGDDLENSKSYSNPSLPVSPKLIEEVVQFIRED